MPASFACAQSFSQTVICCSGVSSALYIAARVCREEENWVRQLEAPRVHRVRSEAGCDAPEHPEQNPDGRWSRHAEASSD
jgi:hypothetical protein